MKMKLKKLPGQPGGKNQNEIKGFYQDIESKDQYFIKKPDDPREFFTELFAGLFIEQMKAHHLIPPSSHEALITATCTSLRKGNKKEYVLIQPRKNFQHLCQLIGTSNAQGTDRNPMKELMPGAGAYKKIPELSGKPVGLSMILMLSLLLGDNSVHSANVIVLEQTVESSHIKYNQFGRIDWGAAFRHFALPANNQDILKSYEITGMFRGVFNLNAWVKDYYSQYTSIPGLLTMISRRAEELSGKLEKEQFKAMAIAALKKIPKEAISSAEQKSIAEYMGLASFNHIQWGQEESYEVFAEAIADIFVQRLDLIRQLQDRDWTEAQKPLPLTLAEEGSFEELIESWAWAAEISRDPLQQEFDASGVDLNLLVEKYLQMQQKLANQAEALNIWEHPAERSENFLSPYVKLEASKLLHGVGFLPFYTEAAVLLKLSPPLILSRFQAFDDAHAVYAGNKPNAPWTKILAFLSNCTLLLSQIKNLKTQPDESYREIIKKLILVLKNDLLKIRLLFLSHKATEAIKVKKDGLFFYEISDEALKALKPAQLLTLCLEEVGSARPGTWLYRILSQEVLWKNLVSFYQENQAAMDARTDEPARKFEQLEDFRATLASLLDLEKKFSEAKMLSEKEDYLAKIHENLEPLPHYLKLPMMERMTSLEESLKEIKREMLAAFEDERQKWEEAFDESKPLSGFKALCRSYQALPKDLQQKVDLDPIGKKIIEHLKGKRMQAQTIRKQLVILEQMESFYRLQRKFLEKAEVESLNITHDLRVYHHLKKIFGDEKSVSECQPVMTLLDNTRFQENVPNADPLYLKAEMDPFLWSELCNYAANNRCLSRDLVNDLLQLNHFYWHQKRRISSEERDCQEALKRFYQEALTIRLSNDFIPVQRRALEASAKKHFEHRNKWARLFADALLLVSCLFGVGIAIGMVRVHCYNSTFFFSQERTDREQDFYDSLGESEESIFKRYEAFENGEDSDDDLPPVMEQQNPQ